jgi:hypothetical protein
MKSREYKAIKNFVHNELGLTKLNCENLFKEAIKDEAKEFIKRKFQKEDINLYEIMKDNVKQEVIKKVAGSSWDSDRSRFYESLGKEIAKQLKIS